MNVYLLKHPSNAIFCADYGWIWNSKKLRLRETKQYPQLHTTSLAMLPSFSFARLVPKPPLKRAVKPLAGAKHVTQDV
jgi:hypothetical protein